MSETTPATISSNSTSMNPSIECSSMLQTMLSTWLTVAETISLIVQRQLGVVASTAERIGIASHSLTAVTDVSGLLRWQIDLAQLNFEAGSRDVLDLADIARGCARRIADAAIEAAISPPAPAVPPPAQVADSPRRRAKAPTRRSSSRSV